LVYLEYFVLSAQLGDGTILRFVQLGELDL